MSGGRKVEFDAPATLLANPDGHFSKMLTRTSPAAAVSATLLHAAEQRAQESSDAHDVLPDASSGVSASVGVATIDGVGDGVGNESAVETRGTGEAGHGVSDVIDDDDDDNNNFAIPRLRNASMPHVEVFGLSELGSGADDGWQKVRASGSQAWEVPKEGDASTADIRDPDGGERQQSSPLEGHGNAVATDGGSTLTVDAAPAGIAVLVADDSVGIASVVGRTASYSEAMAGPEL